MVKKLCLLLLLLLLCACAQNNNQKFLSKQYVDILNSGNYYISYLETRITYDHTPVHMEIARKGSQSAMRYDMNGDTILGIDDNEAITYIVNGEFAGQMPIQDYKDFKGNIGSKSFAQDYSNLEYNGNSGEKTIDTIKYYFETYTYHSEGSSHTIDFMFTDDRLQAMVFDGSGELLKNLIITAIYPDDMFLIPEAHANSLDASSSTPAQRPASSSVVPQTANTQIAYSQALADARSESSQTDDSSSARGIPSIYVKGFYEGYENVIGSVLYVLCPDVIQFDLSYEDTKELLSKIDFSQLIPTDQSQSIDILSTGPDDLGIVFINSTFEYELRFDQDTNIVVYETGSIEGTEYVSSEKYYYFMPDGFYDKVYKITRPYKKKEYIQQKNTIPSVQGEGTAQNAMTGY